ncbi:MAG TPA: 16S rRNA (guanine(527)-N(7))-methyltransferase RsmG [Candidatus Limnocylindrales bacterium]|nr:16S rRNA (guanine(527)-N(7))-methyltransferase RsmG [Candidatus Limnocylindrales bacterium]
MRRAIGDHARLLLAWSAAINLTAVRDPAEVAVRHVVDSLAAVALLRQRSIVELVDLGSGGGYPGLPLAVALPARRAVLVESIGKKAAFLATAVDATGLASRVAVHAGRVESLAIDERHRGRWACVTARAVGALAELVELAFPLLRPGGCLVAWKGRGVGVELAAAERAAAALGSGAIEVHDVDVTDLHGHRLVVATKRGATPPGLPRDPAVRRREPW